MKHILNEYFDHVYCVTGHDFYDRHELAKRQLDGVEFEWIVSPPSRYIQATDTLTSTEISVLIGHLSCVWNAKLHGYTRIVIWEDDGEFTATQDEIRTFLYAVPQEWDCLYMANASWNIWPINIVPHSDGVNRIIWGNGCSFNGIQSHVYDEMIKQTMMLKEPVDFNYNRIYNRGNSYSPSKKFFCDPVSEPTESARGKALKQEKHIPSRITHTIL